ncbi:hypothetical protein D3C84_1218520 [compost metagenome]
MNKSMHQFLLLHLLPELIQLLLQMKMDVLRHKVLQSMVHQLLYQQLPHRQVLVVLVDQMVQLV